MRAFAVVTGGGTSGHVIPARAILDALSEAGHAPDTLKYVGTTRGVEVTQMQGSLYECVFLPISGLQRNLSFQSLVRNAALPWRLFQSRRVARSLIRQWNPSVVVSVGGYASVPMSSAAVAGGIPLVCVSYDRVPGLATRRQARHAHTCAVAFSGTGLPHEVITGAPVRQEVRHTNVQTERAVARARLGIPTDAHVVVVAGGSLGSAQLNTMVGKLLVSLETTDLSNVYVHHICGNRFTSDPQPIVPAHVSYTRVGFEDQMMDLYSALDVFVARAGASTIAEVAALGVPAVLVPWSGAADDHQTLNAKWLADAGGALVFSDAQCDSGEVVSAVVSLLSNGEKRESLARAAWVLGELHRGDALVAAIENATR
jgi:UDP-N-acetylglucosamine--N-acetylmuramyl-(pentapeptide) pyrophosphoryl-undecaprenol N-acetylglucosamine transferase